MKLSLSRWTFLFFLPGLMLGGYCIYFLGNSVYQLVAWNKTTGVVTGLIENEDSEDWSFSEQANFTDSNGNTVEARAYSSVADRENGATGRVFIVYDPANSSNSSIVLFRDYLIVVFLPFAALLVFLGWPFEKRSDI